MASGHQYTFSCSDAKRTDQNRPFPVRMLLLRRLLLVLLGPSSWFPLSCAWVPSSSSSTKTFYSPPNLWTQNNGQCRQHYSWKMEDYWVLRVTPDSTSPASPERKTTSSNKKPSIATGRSSVDIIEDDWIDPTSGYESTSINNENLHDDEEEGDDDDMTRSPYHYDNSGTPYSFTRNTAWLEEATREFLNEDHYHGDNNGTNSNYPYDSNGSHPERVRNYSMTINTYPLGKLTEEDVEVIAGFMAAWVRRRSVEAALIVERLLKRVVDDIRANNRQVRVSTRLYTYAIDAWAKSGAKGSAQRAQRIHDAMVDLYNQTGDSCIAPSTISYNCLLAAWHRNHDPIRADQVLREMIDTYRGGNAEANPQVKPDSTSFATVWNAYARSNVPFRVSRTEELQKIMDELGVMPNCYTYSALQNVYARSGLTEAPARTKAILDDMLKKYQSGVVTAKPTTMNYNDVLTAYSRTPSRHSALQANEFLAKMEKPVEQGGYDVEPDRLSYAVAILACARCPDEALAATLAERNLEKLENQAKMQALKRLELSSAAPPSVTLDVECFNVVLTAISKSRLADAPERSLRIIERMEQYAAAGEKSLSPNLRSWNAVLNAFARSAGRNDRNFAYEAELILQRMFRDKNAAIHPNAFSFAAVLNAYQRSNDPSSIQRAEDIVRQMEQLYQENIIETPPDVFHYTILASVWAKAGTKAAADRCLQILTHMYKRHQHGYPDVIPNVRTYNAVLDCLSRSKQEELAEQLLYYMISRFRNGDKHARPDSFSFNCVIHAFAKSSQRGGGRRAEAILDRFLEFHEENPFVSPDSRPFVHIIAHYSKSKDLDAPYRADYVLNRLISLYKAGNKHLSPTLFSIVAVIESYAYAYHPDAGTNADRLLKIIRTLKTDYNNTKMEVTTNVMNSVLLAWANSGDRSAGYNAQQHLDDMETRYKNGETSVQPDSRSYGLVLSAWSKSNSPEKARQAATLLRRMEKERSSGNFSLKVDEHAYSLVINTCAFCNDDIALEVEAFEIALSLFEEMIESPSAPAPTSLTYGWFIQACGRLRAEESHRMTALEKAFRRCCEDGLLNDFVLHRLKGATTEANFWDLIGTGVKSREPVKSKVSLERLPVEWRRNIKSTA